MSKVNPHKYSAAETDQPPTKDYRTLARQLTVQFLHQLAVQGEDILVQLDRFLYENTDQEDAKDLARKWTRGTWTQRQQVDACIRKNYSNWDLARINLVDQNNLRLAIYHLLYCPDIPPKVVINEAVELAKLFGTEQSPGFINGVLESVRRDIAAKNDPNPTMNPTTNPTTKPNPTTTTNPTDKG